MKKTKIDPVADNIARTTHATAPSAVKPKGWLKSIFNKGSLIDFAVGAAVSSGTKLAVASLTASFLAPSVGIIGAAVATGAVAGAASAIGRHYFKYWFMTKPEDRAEQKLTLKKVAIGALSGATGGLCGHFAAEAFHSLAPAGIAGLMTSLKESIFGHAAPPAVHSVSGVVTPMPEAPAAPAAPIAEPVVVHVTSAPATPLDALKEYAANHDVSDRFKEALERASSTNVHVAAQGMDDAAVFAPRAVQIQAYEVLKEAAKHNLKAQADLIAMEFYGNQALGIRANPDAAIDKMIALSKHSKYAAHMVEKWFDGPINPPGFDPAHVTPPPVEPMHTDIPAETPVPAAPAVEPVMDSAPAPSAQPVTPAESAKSPLKVAAKCFRDIIDKSTKEIGMICKVPADDKIFTVIGRKFTFKYEDLIP